MNPPRINRCRPVPAVLRYYLMRNLIPLIFYFASAKTLLPEVRVSSKAQWGLVFDRTESPTVTKKIIVVNNYDINNIFRSADTYGSRKVDFRNTKR